MSMSQRIDRIRKGNQIAHRQLNQQTVNSRLPRPIRVMYPALAKKARRMVAAEKDIAPDSVFLVARRPPLSEHPLFWRWLARLVYQRINWAPDYGIEYQGVYTDEAEARYAASEVGGFVIAMPLNACLPLQTCQYGTHDFPLSEASNEYRNRKFPFVAVLRRDLDDCLRPKFDRLQGKIRETDPIVKGFRAKAV